MTATEVLAARVATTFPMAGEVPLSRWRRPSPEALLLYGSFGIAVALTFGFSPDDTFITLRYAWDFLHGHGPVFNPGERVNGATSPIGLLMAVVAILIGFGHSLLLLKFFSLSFAALTLDRVRKLVEFLVEERWARALCLLVIGAGLPLAINGATGLETTADSFAIAGLLVELSSGRAYGRPLRAGAFASLAVLARPEAILLVFVLGAGVAVVGQAATIRKRIGWAVPPVAAELLLLAANRLYYGDWLPNTFYAKSVTGSQSIPAGLTYVMHALRPAALYPWVGASAEVVQTFDNLVTQTLLVLLLVGAVLALVRWRGHSFVPLAVCAQVVFAIHAGGDWMKGARFLAPVIVLVPIMQIGAIERLVSAAQRLCNPRALIITVWVLVAGNSLINWHVGDHQNAFALGHGVSDYELAAHGGYGDAWAYEPTLVRCLPAGSLVAATEIGYLGFARLDLRILDLRGLTNRAIAHDTPNSLKKDWGVEDDNWWAATSPVGKVILAAQPAMVITVNPGGSVVLGGSYRYVGYFHHAYSVYLRDGVDCQLPT